MVTPTLESLYGPVDNLSHFIHPEYNRRFSFMTQVEVVKLAVTVVDAIHKSGLNTIIVSESGASPLALICEMIAKKRGYNWQWVYVKFPRDPVTNIFPLLRYYLTAEERENRKPQKNAAMFEGTTIEKRLKGDCLFFDEYIDSGTTLRNALRYLPLLSKDIHIQIGAYYMNLDNVPSGCSVAFHLYDQTSKEQCFADGVYPFENRIDLIGYWYTITDILMKKTQFADKKYTVENEYAVAQFIEILLAKLSNTNVIKKIKQHISNDQIQSYLTMNHLLLFVLYLLEQKVSGSQPSTELMLQIFEMYAPIWSPLPDNFHIEFVSAFEALRSEISSSQEFTKTIPSYKHIRVFLMRYIHRVMYKRHRQYFSSINNLISSYV
ncbi:MAG: hypothetical protein RI947_722 [Candidatus Parcubacteria bacterium]|jgi:hypothetical protein